MYLCSNWVRTRAARVISVMRLGLAVTCWVEPVRYDPVLLLPDPRLRARSGSIGNIPLTYRRTYRSPGGGRGTERRRTLLPGWQKG